jgi:single-strand DNA-binding protein
MNNCTFFGRLGADPEIKNTNSGQKVARFNLAVNRSWVGKDGQKQESTTWTTCIAWEKLAETAEKHLKKGQRVLVTSQYETRSYEVNGEKRWAHEFRVTALDIVDWPEKTEVGAPVTPAPSASPAPAPKPAAAKPLFDEDGELPF